jgi:hypothetical protein
MSTVAVSKPVPSMSSAVPSVSDAGPVITGPVAAGFMAAVYAIDCLAVATVNASGSLLVAVESSVAIAVRASPPALPVEISVRLSGWLAGNAESEAVRWITNAAIYKVSALPHDGVIPSGLGLVTVETEPVDTSISERVPPHELIICIIDDDFTADATPKVIVVPPSVPSDTFTKTAALVTVLFGTSNILVNPVGGVTAAASSIPVSIFIKLPVLMVAGRVIE